MNTNKLRAPSDSTAAVFLTKEQSRAKTTGSLKTFFRLADPLCRKILQLGTDPHNFGAVKSFYPFIRDASVFEIPRHFDMVADWAFLGFNAGVVFGQSLPSDAERILTHGSLECTEALDWVKLLRVSLCRHLDPHTNLYSAFAEICGFRFRRVPLLDGLIAASFNAFKSGLAATTVAKLDPLLAEFARGLRPAVAERGMPLSWRVPIWSPTLAFGRPALEALTHPLIKLAAAYYPYCPLHRETVGAFYAEQLAVWAPLRENQCPASKTHIVEWVKAALAFGHRIQASAPSRIRQILTEVGEATLEKVREATQSVVVRASGTNSASLAAEILKWHDRRNRTFRLKQYSQRLERIVFVVDVALWVAWIPSSDDQER